MDIFSINPFVRFARNEENNTTHEIKLAPDHRIFYCKSGIGEIEVNGVRYEMKKGTLLYWASGMPYRFLPGKSKPVYSGCNFDFTQDYSEYKTPIPPEYPESFLSKNILEKDITISNSIFSQCIYIQNVTHLENIIEEIAKEYLHHYSYYELRCSLLLKDLLLQVIRIKSTQQNRMNPDKISDILKYIHEHFNEHLTNSNIADHFNYNKSYISTLISKHTGLSLHQYVLRYRINMAITLLQSSNMSVSEIGEKVGFPDVKHFSKCFRNIIGIPPSQFKLHY